MRGYKRFMHLKKGLVLILCLVLLCTTVFACGKKEGLDEDADKEVVSDNTGEDSNIVDESQSDESQNDNEDVGEDTAQDNEEPKQDEEESIQGDDTTQGDDMVSGEDSTEGSDEPQVDVVIQDDDETQGNETITDFPRMDGSTSATPLEAGLRSVLYDVSYHEALEQVSHTTTHQSFDRLISGEVDLIFTVPISKEQQDKADANGIELVMEPVAKEGFVFVVNAANPVDSLTQDQIRKIYSGEITNWKEVGGNDAPILAYQRNEDSGSQNYMTDFMGDVPLIDAPITSRPDAMSGIMDAVASYDNVENSIGYSVYSYAAQMYANQNKVKFIAVDGVEPTKASMADGTYPLLSCTYVMYKANNNRVNELAQLTDWMISEEGQNAVLASGYIPVIDMEIPDYYLPYEAVGTGVAKDDKYIPDKIKSYVRIDLNDEEQFDIETIEYTFNSLEDQRRVPDKKITAFKIKFLQDKVFQEQVNKKIEEMISNLETYATEHPDMVYYDPEFYGNMYYTDKEISVEILNGYMSITIGYPFDIEEHDVGTWFDTEGFIHYQYCQTVTYDLINKREITDFSELFYEGIDFVTVLNNALADNIAAYYSDGQMKRYEKFLGVDFTGILGTPEYFTIDRIYFDKDNPYFRIPVMFSYTQYTMKDVCVVWQYRDMTGLFTEAVDVWDSSEPDYEYGTVKIEKRKYYVPIGSRFHSQDELQELRNHFITMQDMYLDKFYPDCPWALDIILRGDCYEVGFREFESPKEYPEINFDASTFEPISIHDQLVDGWKEYIISAYPDNSYIVANDAYDEFGSLLYSGWRVQFFYYNSRSYEILDLPYEYFK